MVCVEHLSACSACFLVTVSGSPSSAAVVCGMSVRSFLAVGFDAYRLVLLAQGGPFLFSGQNLGYLFTCSSVQETEYTISVQFTPNHMK